MKRFVVIVGLFFIIFGFVIGASPAMAQNFPSRPIQLIIPNVAGSIMDINARVIIEELGKILGTQVIITVKPGGATILGTDAVAKSKKDGYTLGYLSASGLVYTRIDSPGDISIRSGQGPGALGPASVCPIDGCGGGKLSLQNLQ